MASNCEQKGVDFTLGIRSEPLTPGSVLRFVNTSLEVVGRNSSNHVGLRKPIGPINKNPYPWHASFLRIP